MDGKPYTADHKLKQGINNGLILDLKRFFDFDSYGSFPGASSSLLVSISFAPANSNAAYSIATQNRTMAYQ